jgi:hypothetical protein
LKRRWNFSSEEVLLKNLVGILLILIFPLAVWGQPAAFNYEKATALIFSSNVHGEIEPCG